MMFASIDTSSIRLTVRVLRVAVRQNIVEWLACWTQAQKGLGSNRSRDAFG